MKIIRFLTLVCWFLSMAASPVFADQYDDRVAAEKIMEMAERDDQRKMEEARQRYDKENAPRSSSNTKTSGTLIVMAVVFCLVCLGAMFGNKDSSGY